MHRIRIPGAGVASGGSDDLAAGDVVPAEDRGVEFNVTPVLDRPGTVGKAHIEKHLAACDAEVDPSHARLWRRLFVRMGQLTDLPVQGIADAVLFFVPDGRYRMQIFALEDQGDGLLHVYLPDVLDEAIRREIVVKTEDPAQFAALGHEKLTLRVDRMDSANTPMPAAHVKNMLGWNRKALRLTLIASDSDSPRVEATEALCRLAASVQLGKGTPAERAGSR